MKITQPFSQKDITQLLAPTDMGSETVYISKKLLEATSLTAQRLAMIQEYMAELRAKHSTIELLVLFGMMRLAYPEFDVHSLITAKEKSDMFQYLKSRTGTIESLVELETIYVTILFPTEVRDTLFLSQAFFQVQVEDELTKILNNNSNIQFIYIVNFIVIVMFLYPDFDLEQRYRDILKNQIDSRIKADQRGIQLSTVAMARLLFPEDNTYRNLESIYSDHEEQFLQLLNSYTDLSDMASYMSLVASLRIILGNLRIGEGGIVSEKIEDTSSHLDLPSSLLITSP